MDINEMDIEVILTFFQVLSSILLTIFTVSMFIFNRKQKLKEQRVLLQIVGAKSPSSFEIICQEKKENNNNPDFLSKTQKVCVVR